MSYINKYIKYIRKNQIGSATTPEFNLFDNLSIECDLEAIQWLIFFIMRSVYKQIPLDIETIASFAAFEKHQELVKSLTNENIPKTLDEIVRLLLDAKISDENIQDFVSVYQKPFMGTNKTLYRLYTINKDVFRETLVELIKSKRIQKIMSGNVFLRVTVTSHIFKERNEEIKSEIVRIQEEYTKKYSPQEIVIANAWIKARDADPNLTKSE
jgi:hypothetical protein